MVIPANTADLVCGRREIFDALYKQFHLEHGEKLQILENYLSTKTKKPFKFHADDKVALKNLLHAIKTKWNESNRTASRFFNKNDEWLKGTIQLKVKIINLIVI